METKICKSCKRRINLFSRITAVRCTNCGADIHSSCKHEGLEYQSFAQKIIKHYHSWCRECAETNSQRFREQRYCSCNADITISQHQAKCHICGAIGHSDCYRNNSIELHREEQSVTPGPEEEVSAIRYCFACKEVLKKAHLYIMSLYSTWIDGTKFETIKGYVIAQTKGMVSWDFPYATSPLQLENILKYRTIVLGGNAFIKFHWDKHEENTNYPTIIGHDIKGNPIYVRHNKVKVWYTGAAMAVLVEPINQRGKIDIDQTKQPIKSPTFSTN